MTLLQNYILTMINILFITYISYVIHIVNSTSVPKVETTNPENHISEQDLNFLNLMVSHYDCAKQNNLRQFILLNVEPCKQAPSVSQHTETHATVYVRAKAKRIKAFKCEAYIKTEKLWCSQTFFPVDDIIVYNGNKNNFQKYLTLLNAKK